MKRDTIIEQGTLCSEVLDMCYDERFDMYEIVAHAEGLVGRELTDTELELIMEESGK